MRLIGISLAFFLLLTVSACDAAKEKEETEPMPDLSKDDFLNLVSFEKSSEEILELAKQYGFIVHNNSTVIYDGGAWKNFYAATQKGEPATLGIAKFISPNDAMTLRCFSFVEFDGVQYNVTLLLENETIEKTYYYLEAHKGETYSYEVPSYSYVDYVLKVNKSPEFIDVPNGLTSYKDKENIDTLHHIFRTVKYNYFNK